MKTQKFKPLTKDQVAYANKAVCRFLADLEEHGVHIVYDSCNGDALLVPADFVNSYAEDGYVEFGNDIAKKIFATETAKSHPWNGWFCDEATDPDTHEVTRWHIGVNTEWKELGETGTEVPTVKKYELTDDTVEVEGHTLHRIRALRDITDPAYPEWEIKKGELGGFVESEENLSHEGSAWVGDDAKVYGNAKVYDDASVCGNAEVSDEAQVYGHAEVRDEAQVSDEAQVCGNAEVSDEAQVYGHAEVRGTSQVRDEALVFGNADVCYEAVWGTAEVNGDGYDEDEPQDSPKDSPDLETRLTTLEGRVDTLAKDMVKTVKEIKDIKKQIAKKPKTAKKAKKRS